MNRRALVLATATSLVLVAFGSGIAPPAAQTPTPAPPRPLVAPREPDPGPPLPPMTYEAKARRDPFAPVVIATGSKGLTIGSAKLVGEWNGTYATDGPSGTMTVTVSKAGETWKLITALGGDTPPAGDVRDIVADGDKISWKQSFGEYDVTFKGSLSADGAQLTGSLEATQGGSPAGAGTFTLTKK